jgi:hypothetical protein
LAVTINGAGSNDYCLRLRDLPRIQLCGRRLRALRQYGLYGWLRRGLPRIRLCGRRLRALTGSRWYGRRLRALLCSRLFGRPLDFRSFAFTFNMLRR